ncbi:MAG: hypothetical protein R3F61_25225 [Myxococcota bacterium]
MEFWQGTFAPTAISVAVLLGVASVVGRRLPIPSSILAGVLGLIAGPGVLGWLPLDTASLEVGVYHALAVVFICIGLQRPAQDRSRGEARAMAFGISTMVAMQTCIGLALALLMGVHAGFGLLLPLGFEQGPGQAMSLGAAWESAGLVDGAQVGLIVAAIGFGWSVFAGVPLVIAGRRLGWETLASAEPADDEVGEAVAPESLTSALALLAAVYAVTWATCSALSGLLAAMPDIAAMVWGFHFLIGALWATAARSLMVRVAPEALPGNGQLAQLSGTTVDLATVAALSAVQLAVLGAWWMPILAITTAGGLATLFACVWLARRGFRSAPFEHAVMWFGMSTGTLPVGLALLRAIDPRLRSPAPASAVFGSALSIPGVAPVIVGLHPLAIAGSPGLALGLCTAWLCGLLVAWWSVGGLQLREPA